MRPKNSTATRDASRRLLSREWILFLSLPVLHVQNCIIAALAAAAISAAAVLAAAAIPAAAVLAAAAISAAAVLAAAAILAAAVLAVVAGGEAASAWFIRAHFRVAVGIKNSRDK